MHDPKQIFYIFQWFLSINVTQHSDDLGDRKWLRTDFGTHQFIQYNIYNVMYRYFNKNLVLYRQTVSDFWTIAGHHAFLASHFKV